MQDGYLVYAFVRPGFVLRATSGALAVNEAGEVAAINPRGGTAASGVMIGMGNPASAWGEALGETCKKADNSH